MDTRPSWDEYFMQIARDVATRATCLRRHVGAVVVRNRRILSTGYNGSPPGQPHCTEVGCLMEDDKCIRTLHAEQNALIQAALHGVSTEGATLYATCRPCHVCARMIVGAGIVRVVFHGQAPEGWAQEVLRGAGVELVCVPDPIASGGGHAFPHHLLPTPNDGEGADPNYAQSNGNPPVPDPMAMLRVRP